LQIKKKPVKYFNIHDFSTFGESTVRDRNGQTEKVRIENGDGYQSKLRLRLVRAEVDPVVAQLPASRASTAAATRFSPSVFKDYERSVRPEDCGLKTTL
jgi:hypothetical protein